MDRDTIVALGTPPGESAIAVVRLSGPEAIEIAERLAPGSAAAPSHTLALRRLGGSGAEPIDEGLVAVMRAPSSYTGEDLVEIYCHGGMQIVAELIEAIEALGARPALPGEFTKRAYLSGRMDLAQAEAVADLIAAETRLQRAVALEQLGGRLSRAVRECEDALLGELAIVEASIDFPEEELPPFDAARARGAALAVRERIARLLESETAGNRLRHGLRVTILGPRNVGKSSLYNALLGEERAIVSPIPGTTRDVLRERIHIGGFTCHLEDTAGMAETRCEVEAKGMLLGRAAAERADLVLFVIDGSAPLDDNVREEAARLDRSKSLLVINKNDLELRADAARLKVELGFNDSVSISAKSGAGLDEIREWIYERGVRGPSAGIERERVAVNLRQASALRDADEAIARALALLGEGAPLELLGFELRAAGDSLGTITGRSISSELLDEVFSKFCIGK